MWTRNEAESILLRNKTRKQEKKSRERETVYWPNRRISIYVHNLTMCKRVCYTHICVCVSLLIFLLNALAQLFNYNEIAMS